MKKNLYPVLFAALMLGCSGGKSSDISSGSVSLQLRNAQLEVDTLDTEPIGTDISTLVEPCPGEPGGGGECANHEVEAQADLKCHMDAKGAPSSIHCVVKYEVACSGNKGVKGTVPAWFKPSGASQSPEPAGCSNVGDSSLLARLAALPMTTGQYHFAGSVEGCLPKDKVCGPNPVPDCHQAVSDSVSAELLKLFAEANGTRVSVDQVRKGNTQVSLSSGDVPDLDALYCVGHGKK